MLDLGAACQANISFFTGLGHKIYTEDICRALPSNAYRVRGEDRRWRFDIVAFLAENLNYQMLLFDAVLCWDLFDRVEESAVRPLVDRLHWVLKPGGALLSFFHTAGPGDRVPTYRYRIQGPETLELLPRGQITLRRPLNNPQHRNPLPGVPLPEVFPDARQSARSPGYPLRLRVRCAVSGRLAPASAGATGRLPAPPW